MRNRIPTFLRENRLQFGALPNEKGFLHDAT